MRCPIFLLVVSAFQLVIYRANCEKPLTANEYRDNLGVGFSTSWFKTSLRKHYSPESMKKTLKDMVVRGIGHLRLRCMSNRHGFPEPKGTTPHDPAPKKMDEKGMKALLDELEFVVDEMLKVGLYPVISWIGKHVTARGSEQDGKNYVQWWTEVAKRMKDKSYKLSFDLVTEMEKNMEKSDPGMAHNLHENTTGLSDWMRRAIKSIRKTGGNNAERVIILVTPQNTKEESLYKISEDIFNEENRPIIQEYHICASGYHSIDTGRLRKARCAWTGKQESWEKEKLTGHLDNLAKFGKLRKVPLYFGAWMANDQDDKTAEPANRNSFAKFFTQTMKKYNLPSTINEINKYYDVGKNVWVTKNDMDKTLDIILEEWKK